MKDLFDKIEEYVKQFTVISGSRHMEIAILSIGDVKNLIEYDNQDYIEEHVLKRFLFWIDCKNSLNSDFRDIYITTYFLILYNKQFCNIRYLAALGWQNSFWLSLIIPRLF